MAFMIKLANGHLRTWIEVDRAAIAHNYRAFRKLLARPKGLGLGPKTNPVREGSFSNGVKLMAIAKSNAYGHGLIPYSKLLVKLGADWLGVDSIVEAQTLRAAGITDTPILVLGYTRPDNFAAAAAANVSLTVSTFEALRALKKLTPMAIGAGRKISAMPPLRWHLKVDTGMHRQGFLLAEFPKFLNKLKKFQAVIKVEGIYSHLAAASDQKLKSSVQNQIQEFEKFLDLAATAGWPRESLLKHLSASGGALAYPDLPRRGGGARYDLVRLGLGLFGLEPGQLKSKIILQPALTWKTIVSEIKTLPAAGRVGYDLTERVKDGTRLAICPIGYWHGYPRFLSGVGRVRIKNQFAKITGRVSMDMIAINVTKIKNLKVGDEVVLLDGQKGPTAEELAELAQTSSYEIITRLNPLIERFYV